MILEESTYITAASLPIAITRPDGQPAAAAPRTEIPTEGLSLEDNERMLLARALEKTGGKPDSGRAAAAHHPRHAAV